ncbi:MAG: hypothetical protein ACRD2J_14280 [Thermoanaerobaculia bacterium]
MKAPNKRASAWMVAAVIAAVGSAWAGTPVNEASFSMTLPDGFGQFTKQVQKDKKVTTLVAKSDQKGVVIVSFALMAPTEDLDAFLARERDSLVKSLKATLASERSVEVDGKEALTFHYMIPAAQPMFGRADLIVADPRMYQVIYVAASEQAVNSAETTQMFSSFNVKEAELERVKAEAEAAAQATLARNTSESEQ